MVPPQTDHFTLDTGRTSLGGTDESPLPGHTLRPGIPVPPNARLSLGLGIGVPATPTRKAQPTTTIRLVSNPLSQQDVLDDPSCDERESGTPQLKPFQTTFDITFGSPVPGDAFNSGFSGLSSWPPKRTGAEMTSIHSALTPDVITPPRALPRAKSSCADEEGKSHGRMPLTPFIFGSPHHKVSNNQFREAATSVLEEMNSRLRAEGVDEIGVDIINKLHPSRESLAAQRVIKPIPTLKRGEITSRFDDVHLQEFSKMEGIDTFRKRPQSKEMKKADDDKGNPVVGRKRKSSVLEDAHPHRPSVANKARVSTTRVISNGRRKVVPGGFGLDDEDEEVPDDSRAGKRVRVDSDSIKVTEESKREEEEHELQLEKEKEVIRKKLEANRARRRSSAAARKSLGRNGPRPSVLSMLSFLVDIDLYFLINFFQSNRSRNLLDSDSFLLQSHWYKTYGTEANHQIHQATFPSSRSPPPLLLRWSMDRRPYPKRTKERPRWLHRLSSQTERQPLCLRNLRQLLQVETSPQRYPLPTI